MNVIDGSRVDLNLFSVLGILLEEGSVTRAARRLGVGQPATSHALTRLRRLFGDPLFVQVGRQIVPTPRAEALREPLARVLAEATRLVTHETGFDPLQTTRPFALVCPDLLAPLLPRLVTRLSAAAPKVRLEVLLPGRDDVRGLEEGRIDLALVPTPEQGPGLLQRGLGAVRFAVVVGREHPLARARQLTRDRWAAYPHVLVRTGHGGRSIVGGELERAQFEREIGLVVPTFLSALVALSGTNLVFTAPRELVAPFVDCFQLRILPLPIRIPKVPVSGVWHERFHADPGPRFFRGMVLEEVSAALRLASPRGARAARLPPRSSAHGKV